MCNSMFSYTAILIQKQCSCLCKGYRGILCGSCEPGYGGDGQGCRECASRGLHYFLLLMLIFWSIGFVGYFVRSVLQVSKRIEFNKKFKELSTFLPSEKEPKKNSLTKRSHERDGSASGQPSSEIQSDRRDDLSVDVPSPSRRLRKDALREQTLFLSSTVRPSQKDLARATAIEINRQRTPDRLRTGAQSEFSLRRSRNRKQATLSTTFRRQKSNISTQAIESLPLANPFSEVFKARAYCLEETLNA